MKLLLLAILPLLVLQVKARDAKELDPACGCSKQSFCGTDGKCHLFGCENFYRYAHPPNTNYDPDRPLKCDPIVGRDSRWKGSGPVCPEDYPPVAVRSADADAPGSSCALYNDTDLVFLNRKCTSTDANATTFVCYDVDPSSVETAFADYESKTLGSAQEHDYSVYFEGVAVPDEEGVPTTFGVATGPDRTQDFNVSLAATSMYSVLRELEEPFSFPYCDPGCKMTEFCGGDGMCYARNCRNMYQHGPIDFVGHDGNPDGALECSSTLPEEYQCDVDGNEDIIWPIAVRALCYEGFTSTGDRNLCGNATSSEVLSYNRFCTASPNPTQTFTCFDFDPNTNLADLAASYLEAAADSLDCGDDGAYHSVRGTLSGLRRDGGGSVSTTADGFNVRPLEAWHDWQTERLGHMMHTSLNGRNPPAPTSTPAPDEPASAVAAVTVTAFVLGSTTWLF